MTTTIARAPWKDSPSVAARALVGNIVLDENGEWAVSDAPTTPDGFMAVDVSGELVVDDAAVSGMPVRVIGLRNIIAVS